MSHTVLTFISKVKPDRVRPFGANCSKRSTKILRSNAYVPFRSLGLLHFASFTLHQSPKTPEYGPYLVFENNFDGELDDYLEDLYAHASSGLHQIYSACLDYAVKSASDRQGIIDYLSAHVVASQRLSRRKHRPQCRADSARAGLARRARGPRVIRWSNAVSRHRRIATRSPTSSSLFAAIRNGRGFLASGLGKPSQSNSSNWSKLILLLGSQ